MKTIRYKSWDWELDKGENIDPRIRNSSDSTDNSYAELCYDERGYLFRVKVITSTDCDIYDYYCNNEGEIVEKRSLDDAGNVFVVVRYKYDEKLGEIHETAWYSESNKMGESSRKDE